MPFLWVSLRLFCCVTFQIQFPHCGFSWFRSAFGGCSVVIRCRFPSACDDPVTVCRFPCWAVIVCGSAAVGFPVIRSGCGSVAFIFALFRAFVLSMGCCSFSFLKALFSPFSALYAVLNLLVYARCGYVVNVHFASLPCVALCLPLYGLLYALLWFCASVPFCGLFAPFGAFLPLRVCSLSAAVCAVFGVFWALFCRMSDRIKTALPVSLRLSVLRARWWSMR